ncbi:hypothetical protein [Intestinibacter sp.]|uniref:hypothetical protein n=1 Tax=Intestinibacter sp. TaxID=1965304 RepID=UPI003F17D370
MEKKIYNITSESSPADILAAACNVGNVNAIIDISIKEDGTHVYDSPYFEVSVTEDMLVKFSEEMIYQRNSVLQEMRATTPEENFDSI